MRFATAMYETQHALVLIVGPVGELVVAQGVVVAFSVVLFDILIVTAEVDQSLCELFNASDNLSELGQVVHVLELHHFDGRSNTKARSSSKSFHLKLLLKNNYLIVNQSL